MVNTNTWDILPPFEQSLSLTFLGLDKNKAHTFKVKESLNEPYIQYFGLTKDKLRTPVEIIIEGRSYPAQFRWGRLNRTKTIKLKPEDLPKRDTIFFEWGTQAHLSTQMKMADVFRNEIEIYRSGSKLPKRRFRMHHLRSNIFLFITDQGTEFV